MGIRVHIRDLNLPPNSHIPGPPLAHTNTVSDHLWYEVYIECNVHPMAWGPWGRWVSCEVLSQCTRYCGAQTKLSIVLHLVCKLVSLFEIISLGSYSKIACLHTRAITVVLLCSLYLSVQQFVNPDSFYTWHMCRVSLSKSTTGSLHFRQFTENFNSQGGGDINFYDFRGVVTMLVSWDEELIYFFTGALPSNIIANL
jgi:hypothetical protein